MKADALSTAHFVMGAERGMDWLRSIPETDALLILKDGRRMTTPGFPFST
jgi:thiamine biosynthesis lipoprotein ApbE